MRLRFFLSLLSFLPCVASAAAWLQPEGNVQLIANAFLYSTNEAFDSQGRRQSANRFTKLELNPYLEWGYSKDLTLGLSQSYQHLSQNEDHNAGLADTELFLRTKLWEKGNKILSIQPLVKIPGAYDSEVSPALGNGQADAELRLLYGHAFEWQKEYHFVNLEAGYRKRFEQPSDEIRFDATLGLRYTPEWMLLLQSYNTLSTDTKTTGGLQLSNSRDYDLSKLQLSVVYRIDDTWSVQAGGFSHVKGENTGAGEGLLLSFWKNF